MTVDEIKRELDDLGVEYPPDARKPELEEMLAKAAEGAATAPETPAPDPEPEPAPEPTVPEESAPAAEPTGDPEITE